MSSLAGRLSSGGDGPGAVVGRRAIVLPWVRADIVVCGGVALVLAGIAFGAGGGTQLARTTYTEIAVMLGCAGLVAVALLETRETRLHGGWTLAGLTALAALTALSITWSLAPADSWLETSRLLTYVAAFAAALALVRLAPARWPSVVGGVALAGMLLVVWALLTKVFPGALAPEETYARLRAPYDYWNAVGLTAALAIPPLLWLAAKRSGNQALNALAYPALGLSLVCLMLSYSRGALLALAIGLIFWFVAVPLRLRAAVALAVSVAAAALVVAWVFAREALTDDEVPLVARTEAGHELGALLALMAAVLLVAGLAIGFAAANRAPGPALRGRAGRALIVLVALLPVAGVGVLATQPGGLGGQLSERWTQLTDPSAGTPSNSPGRLTATASVRSRYWREAMEIWQAHQAVGAGAGSFAIARTRYRTGELQVRQAHGYVVETLAGLGLVGLGLSLALLAAWLAAAARSLGIRRKDRGLPMDAERVGLLTLAAVVVVFGVHSLVDLTWLVPGTAIIALVCAAWVVGRGPLRERVAGRPAVAAVAVPWRARLGTPRAGLGVAVVLAALAASWAAFQPLRASHASDRAFDRLDANAPNAAVDIAQIAVRRNPLSVEPLFDLASIQDAIGRPIDAERTLERAVSLQPANARAWRRLGEHRALALDQPERGLAPLRAAYYLDPRSSDTEAAFLNLRRILADQKAAGTP